MIRIAIRGWGSGSLLFDENAEFADMEAAEYLMPALAEKHAHILKPHRLYMIEIEFLDEPDPLRRFCRRGTDTSLMVNPVPVEEK